MSIENVDFGRFDAESEEHLLEYFVETDVVKRLTRGSKQFVIWRKGSGKTALFRRLDDDVLGHSAIKLDFDDYSWAAHKLVRENGISPEAAYVASWRFTFLMTIVAHWARFSKGKTRSESVKIMRQIYGAEDPAWHQLLFDNLRRIRRLNLPSIEGVASLGGIEIAESDGPLVASSIGVWAKKASEFVADHFDDYPVTLLLDRLDEGWDASDESKNMLAGAIKAAREFNLVMRSANRASTVIVFLRSDIFQNLHFNDKNKIGVDIEYLDWDEGSLFEVAAARISRSLGCSRSKAWDLVFSSERMRQRATIRSYIAKRTMLRPRDIVAYCIQCQEAANRHEHNVVQTDDVYEAEDGYSLHVYQELDDEMHKQLPRARESLQVIRDMQQQKFMLNDWMDALKGRG